MKAKLIPLVLLVFSISVFAQNVDVPKNVQAEFLKLYPKTTEVKWNKENKSGFEAEFKENGISISIVMNGEGKVIETETKIDKKDLPGSVESFVMKNYKGYKITEAAKIVDAKGVLIFEAEISKGDLKKDLLFDKDGKLIVKEKDNSVNKEVEKDNKD